MTSPAALALGTPQTDTWRRAFLAALFETRAVAVVLAAYVAAAIAVSLWLDAAFLRTAIGYLPVVAGMAFMGILMGLLALLLKLAVVDRSSAPTRDLLATVRALARPERAAFALVFFGGLAILQTVYAFFKPLIPRFVPYSWDPLFAAADRLIFFGHDAWRVVWPLFGHPLGVWTINVLYHLWFFWMLLVWVLVAFATRHRGERVRFLMATVLTWLVGGTILATVFSAVGPCYYGVFVPGPNPFAELMANLFAINDHAPVYALAVQDMLLRGQMNPSPGVLAGISALPSMHIADAVLRTRIAFVYSRRFGMASLALTGVICVGSVLLGWHYAVDGIAGAIVALAAWWVSGKIVGIKSRRV